MAKWAGLNGRHEARPVLSQPKHDLARKSSRPGRHGLIVQAGPGLEVWLSGGTRSGLHKGSARQGLLKLNPPLNTVVVYNTPPHPGSPRVRVPDLTLIPLPCPLPQAAAATYNP
jgi:hypothetical protein